MRHISVKLLACSSLLVANAALAQQTIKVAQTAWDGLTPSERTSIQQQHIVELAGANSFGLIIDNQGVNESTPGTNGGAALGSAIGQAAYIDNAIKGGNYSAKTQLGVAILGAVVGSSLDKPATQQYHYRYAVKFADGDIKYFDSVQADPFRHPAGVCVSTPHIALVDQKLCAQSADSLRVAYLKQVVSPITSPANVQASAAVVSDAVNIKCKVGNLAPVHTTSQTCSQMNGVELQ